jgi:hypothetical protein
MELETQVTDLLRQRGPQTGADLLEQTRREVRELWAACQRAPEVRFEVVGRRYLRLDRSIEGYARLSPSIRREFQTYTVLGHRSQSAAIAERAEQLAHELRRISQGKLELARQSIQSAVSALPDAHEILQRVCFVLAGDITYQMAHAVPRPESSTGELVRGSDLDIVAVTDDELPAAQLRALDAAIYKQKHYLLVHPQYREEIDYLIKDLARVDKQLAFDTFESMVACKILHEGEHLYGSRRVFDLVKQRLHEHGISARLAALEQHAVSRRERAEQILLDPPADLSDREVLTLFYTREESEEIF